ELREGQILGPIYRGLPDVGCVDFTEAGADLWRRLCERSLPVRRLFAYTDVVHDKTARFFRSRAAAIQAVEESRRENDVVSCSGPTPIGPWRAQWWRRFPDGYRIDIEERRQWQGRFQGFCEECHFICSTRTYDPAQLEKVLNRYNVGLAEWLMLASMESG